MRAVSPGAAAEALIAYWRGDASQDGVSRAQCARIEAALGHDTAAMLAAWARADPESARVRVRDVLQRARDPELLALLDQGDAAAGGPGSVFHGGVHVAGSANVVNLAMGAGDTIQTGSFSHLEDAPRYASRRETGPAPQGGRGAARPMVILLAAAAPSDASRVRTDVEAREVRQALKLPAGDDRFHLHLYTAVRADDFVGDLHDLRPDVVHFAGHGGVDGGLYFENALGESSAVPPEALAEALASVGSVRCLVLNACYSLRHAEAAAAHVQCTMGVAGWLRDASALAFSAGFYRALGVGRSFREAHRAGVAQMRMCNASPDELQQIVTGARQPA